MGAAYSRLQSWEVQGVDPEDDLEYTCVSKCGTAQYARGFNDAIKYVKKKFGLEVNEENKSYGEQLADEIIRMCF